MGWFLRTKKTNARTLKFSSPSGDGLVLSANAAETCFIGIFVPEWGWVGSQSVSFYSGKDEISSPSGDGLVLDDEIRESLHTQFSSPSGDGLVHEKIRTNGVLDEFSSPSGVGLVHDCNITHWSISRIFVPEWGWVGSRLQL